MALGIHETDDMTQKRMPANFNSEDPPEAYRDPSIHSYIAEYTAMARVVHGPEFDPST